MRTARNISRGTCAICHAPLTKSSASRHLANCLARHPASRSISGFHLLIESAGAPQYWMHLAARSSAVLGELDDFLREAWLECCSHCSAFTIGGRRYDVTDQRTGWLRKDDLGMSTKLIDVLRPGLTFDYEYDFGSTTELSLRVVAELAHMPRGKAIQLLALNDPPSYPCSICGKPADVVDSMEEAVFCKACAREHAEEDMTLPLVNSPRTGVCAYSGPVIRIRRKRAEPAPVVRP